MACASIAVFVLLPELQAELGLSTASLGPVAGASFLAAFLAQLLLAPLADKGGERLLLVGALILGIFIFQIRERFDSLDTRHLERLTEQ